MNRKSELIAVARIGKEVKVIERHVQVTEVCILPEHQVVLDDPIQFPNESQSIFALNAIGLAEQLTKVGGHLNAKR